MCACVHVCVCVHACMHECVRACMHACVHACVHSHNSKTAQLNFANFFCMLPVAMTRSSSNDVSIRYVLLLLRMTSCFHTLGPVAESQKMLCLEEVYQVAIPYKLNVRLLQCLVEFIRMWHGGELSMIILLVMWAGTCCVLTTRPTSSVRSKWAQHMLYVLLVLPLNSVLLPFLLIN